MSQAAIQFVVGRLRQAVQTEQTSDGALLDAFVIERSESAFAELVRRHGPMVWGVCWRVLASRHDAEDCYQATFLVLIRKAGTVRPRSRVGAWLHGVAYHTALKARQMAARRKQTERQVDPLPEPMPAPDPLDDLRHLLDRGLSELPEKYRIPIVLCELEGRAIKEVAEEMGRPIGTVAGWLARGRDLLARRLVKHGLSAAVITTLLAEKARAGPPPVSSASASQSALALADAAVRTLFFASLKSWLLSAAAMLILLCSVGMLHVAFGNGDERLRDHEGNPARDGGMASVQKDPKKLITDDTQKAIDEGLKYLAKQQTDDGSWGKDSPSVAVTSIAGLAFLSGKHVPDQGEHGKVVTKALRHVLSNESADVRGYFYNPRAAAHGPMYGQAFAVLFLADAHEMTTDKKLQREIREALDRGVKLLVQSQNQQGGWRYLPTSKDADISVTAGQVVALAAARGVGCEVPKATLEKAADYIKSCQDPNTGGFRYQTFGGPPGFARTAAAVAALHRTGLKEDKAVQQGLDFLKRFEPGKGDGLANTEADIHYFYGHYYAAKCLGRLGGERWTKWYTGIRDELLKKHRNADHWKQGVLDPHYCTAMALIVLQTPHGHLPSMKR